MSANLLFYKDVVPVDRNQHKAWHIRAIPDTGFSRNAHSVLVLGSEFAEASREYPIIFIRNEGRVAPVVMLGLREGENLFVDAGGKWNARYVPAYVRRYPFTFTELPNGQLLFSLDAAYPGLDKTGKQGEAMFDDEGKETPLMKNMLTFAESFQADYQRTLQLCQLLDKLGLLKDMNVDAQLVSGGRYNMGGFQVVDEGKLLALDKDELHRLFKNGMLGTIYAHLISLGNVTSLMNRLAEREAKAPETKH